MADFNINQIKSYLVKGGARPTLFQVRIKNPANGSADSLVPFMVQGTQIPPSITGYIDVPFFGRKVKLAGDRIYPSWTVDVINDEDFPIRNALEEWSNRINGFGTNARTIAGNNYKSEAEVIQYAKTGETLRVYQLHGVFPTEIAPIDLNWSMTDQNESFSVTFEYDYWTIVGGTTDDAGGEG